MLKSRAAALDLADYDVVEDDGDLVVGPLMASLSARNSSGKPLAGSSFKGSSILGSVAVAAKLAHTGSVPLPAASGQTSLKLASNNGLYLGGHPIIATASSSRPSSAAVRQPRSSAPSGYGAPLSPPGKASSVQSRSAHGGLAGESGLAGSADTVAGRTQGDILGGDTDDDSPARKGKQPVLGRHDSNRNSSPWSPANSLAGKPGAVDPSPAATPSKGAAVVTAGKSASDKSMRAADSGVSSRRASCEGGVPGTGRSSALPSVDVEPERKHRLLRQAEVAEGQEKATVVVAVNPKAAAGAAKGAAEQGGSAGAAGVCPLPQPAQPACSCPAENRQQRTSMDARPTSGRFLSRLVSGSNVVPAASEQPQHDGRTAAERGDSVGAFRQLFSRPSSARRRSEVGAQQQQTPGKQQRHGQHGQPESIVAFAEAQEEVPKLAVGGGRQPSGLLKRTASVIAAALGR